MRSECDAADSESNSTGRPLLLGVDGGGTSTEAQLAEPGGRVLGRSRSGPSNAKAVGLEASRRAIDTAIDAAFHDAGISPQPVEVACLGIAGFGRPEDRELLERWSVEANWCRRLITATDGDLVVAAGTPEGWGVGVIAGTGSIAVARAADGRASRAGGWGFLMGDEGSAYAVALAALRLVARRADGRERSPALGLDSTPRDPLTVHLCNALEVSQPMQIIPRIYSPNFDRSRIAALAPTVLEAAAEDPEVVARILIPAGADLAELADAAARALDLGRDRHRPPLPVALAGSFLLATDVVRQALIDGLTARGYQVLPADVADPVRGAVILANRALGADR